MKMADEDRFKISEVFRYSAYSIKEFPTRPDLVYVTIVYTDVNGKNETNITLLCQKEELALELPKILESLQEE